MQTKNLQINKWILLAVSFTCLWIVTSRLEDQATNEAWHRYINKTLGNKPNEHRVQYTKLLNTYQNKLSPALHLNGTYTYKNNYMQLKVTFSENEKIKVIKTTFHSGENIASARYKVIGSTMIFSEITPSSATWRVPGHYREAAEAFPSESQPFEIINDKEIHWIGVKGRWKLIKQ